jgi:hypothetical protein
MKIRSWCLLSITDFSANKRVTVCFQAGQAERRNASWVYIAIRSMFLTNMVLQEVQSGAFANMTRLVRLILTKNKIHRLEEGSLTGASLFVSQVRLYLSHRCVYMYICLTGASIFVSQVRLYLSHRRV